METSNTTSTNKKTKRTCVIFVLFCYKKKITIKTVIICCTSSKLKYYFLKSGTTSVTFPKRSVKSETIISIHCSREVKNTHTEWQDCCKQAKNAKLFLTQCYNQEHLATWIFRRGDLDFLCLPFLNMTQTFCAYHF